MWLILFLFSLSFRFALCETKKYCLFVYFNLHVCFLLCKNKLFDISPKYFDVVTVEECMFRLFGILDICLFPFVSLSPIFSSAFFCQQSLSHGHESVEDKSEQEPVGIAD